MNAQVSVVIPLTAVNLPGVTSTPRSGQEAALGEAVSDADER